MITSRRIPPIAIYVSSSHSVSASFGKGEGVDEESNKRAWKGELAFKKVVSLTQIPLCTFFCNSIFPSDFLMKFIVLQRARKRAHPRKSLPVYLKQLQYIIFAQKHQNPITLSKWVVYKCIKNT